MHRRHAARRAHRADAVFERRQPLFQHCRRRIGDARVDVAGAFQIEQSGGVIGIVEHVRRGLIDRHRARARDRIGVLTGMQAQGLERRRFRRGHCSSRMCNARYARIETAPCQCGIDARSRRLGARLVYRLGPALQPALGRHLSPRQAATLDTLPAELIANSAAE